MVALRNFNGLASWRNAENSLQSVNLTMPAERFLKHLKERLGCFELDLHPDKTRLIEFGRFARKNRQHRGLGKPETFDFLGFTHYCEKDRKGRFQLGRKPVAKRMTRTLKRIKEELRRRMHHGVEETGKWLGQVLNGWLNYFAVPTVNGGAKLVHPGGAKLVHLTLCGTRCWGVVPVVHRRDPRCFV